MFTRARLTRWTNALRASPEEQTASILAKKDLTGFCCLGKLCQIEGISLVTDHSCGNAEYVFPSDSGFKYSDYHLRGTLAREFGSETGCFEQLNMPNLIYAEESHSHASDANDAGVPWSVIADHFDKHYPCSDEQPKETK